jgi:hypothetical protein
MSLLRQTVDPIQIKSVGFMIRICPLDDTRKRHRMDVCVLDLLDRVYDLRQKCGSVCRSHPNELELCLNKKPLDDETFLGQLGQGPDATIHYRILPVGVSRLYFSDLEGRSRIFEFSDNQHTKFADITRWFHPVSACVTFWRGGAQINPWNVVNGFACDPCFPIEVRWQALEIRLRFSGKAELKDETMEIEATTTAADVLAQLRPRFLRQFALSMNLSGKELKNERLVDANPWLLSPFEIVVADRPAAVPYLYEYQFIYPGNAVVQVLPPDFATGKTAREQLVGSTAFRLAVLWIYRKERLVQNSERLKPACQYTIVQNQRIKTVKLSLEPAPADRFYHKLKQEFSFDLDKNPNLWQLSTMLAGLLSLPSVTLSEAGRTEPLPGATDSNTLTNIQVNFPGPSSPGVSYRFSMRGPTKGKATLTVGSNGTVLDVKAGLGGIQNGIRRLPGVFSLWFWGCELQDDDKFLEYGIPANCTIVAEFKQEWELKVRELGAREISYVFSESDSIDELEMMFYRAHPDVANGTIGAFVGDTRLVGSEFIKQFDGGGVLTIRRVLQDFEFVIDGDQQPIRMPVDSTVNDALTLLSDRLEVPAERIELKRNGRPVATETGRLDGLGVIEVSIISDNVKADFLFEGRHVVIDLQSDLMFSEIAHFVGAELGIPAVSLEFKLGRDYIDRDMCIADFDGATQFEVTALRPPEPVPVPVQIPASPAPAAPDVVKYQVILGLGVIPRVGNFSLPAGGTVKELEIQCRMKWGLEDLDVELVRRNIQTDETFPLNPETLVSSLQLDDDFSLICTERAVEPPPGQALRENRARTGTRIVHVADDVNSLKVTHSGVLVPGHFELAFRVEQRDMHFKERFARCANKVINVVNCGLEGVCGICMTRQMRGS